MIAKDFPKLVKKFENELDVVLPVDPAAVHGAVAEKYFELVIRKLNKIRNFLDVMRHYEHIQIVEVPNRIKLFTIDNTIVLCYNKDAELVESAIFGIDWLIEEYGELYMKYKKVDTEDIGRLEEVLGINNIEDVLKEVDEHDKTV